MTLMGMFMGVDWATLGLARSAGVAGLLAGYGLLCASVAWRHRRRPAPALAPAPGGGQGPGPVLVLHASQTGRAEHLAQQTAARLQAAGTPAQLRNLADLDLAELRAARRAVWLVSTTGEGDPPDPALPFLKQVAHERARGSRAEAGEATPWPPYLLLALGDRRYAAFCAFGAEIEALCHAHGAQPLAPRIELDGDDAQGLACWWQALAPLGASGAEAKAALDDQTLPGGGAWRLVERRWLNPGSSGAPLYQLGFAPPEDRPVPQWRAGDLALVQVPDAQGQLQAPRSYSIASLPGEGPLQLLVRQQRQPDGRLGLASGWLSTEAPLQAPVTLTLRDHPRFHARPEDLAQPALLIGGGSGLAGLRSHLAARAQAGAAAGPSWLIFGERHAGHDRPCAEDLARWQATGVLQRLDLVFSRETAAGAPRHVQDVLYREGQALRDWLARGARLYVCGSLSGLGQGVDDALQALLGAPALAQLSAQGRYLRDLY